MSTSDGAVKVACKAGQCLMLRGGFDTCPTGRCVEKGTSVWQKVEAIWQCPACGHQISTSPSFCGVVDCSCGAGKIMELLSMTVDGVVYDGDRPLAGSMKSAILIVGRVGNQWPTHFT